MTTMPVLVDVPDLSVDDEALLHGAASLWAVLEFSAEIPATPETRASLAHARQALRAEMAMLGLTVADIQRALGHEEGGSSAARGSPPAAS